MNTTRLAVVSVLALLLIDSTLSVGKWVNISPVPHSPKANLYQSQLYGYSLDTEKPSSTLRSHNSFGTSTNARLITYPSKTNIFHGSYPDYSLRRTFSTPRPSIRHGEEPYRYPSPVYIPNRVNQTVSRFRGGFGSAKNANWNRFVKKININYLKSPYDINYKLKPTFLTSQLKNRIVDRPSFPWINYNTKRKSSSRVFLDANGNPKQEFLASGRQNGIGNRTSGVWVPYPNENNPKVEPLRISSHEVKHNSLTPQLQNVFGNMRQLSAHTNRRFKQLVLPSSQYKQKVMEQRPRDGFWNRRKGPWPLNKARNIHYQMRSQVSNQNVKTAKSPMLSSKMNRFVPSTPYGRIIKPQISPWLPHVRHGGIPYTEGVKKSRVPPFGPSPGSVESTDNYQSQSNVARLMMKPVSSQNNGGDNYVKDTALQDVLSKVSPREDQLIPEYFANQMGASRSIGLAYAMEREERPVPRKSYVSTVVEEGHRLSTPELIKLKQILQSMRKRSISQANSENENGNLYSRFHSDAKQLVKRSSLLDSYNSVNKAEKDNSKNIRKVKGRQKWGLISEFLANVSLAATISLKQMQHNRRKTTVKELGNRSGEERMTAKRRAKMFEISGYNRPVNNVKANMGNETEPVVTPHDDVKYRRKQNDSSKLSGRKSHHDAKKHYGKINRMLARKGNHAFFFNRTGAHHLNRQFLPLSARVPGLRRLKVFFNNRELLDEMQIEIERRMRAMSFHTRPKVHPWLLFTAPFQYQPFLPSQEYRLPAQKIPPQFRAGTSRSGGFSKDTRESQKLVLDPSPRNLGQEDHGNHVGEDSKVKFPDISLHANRSRFNENKREDKGWTDQPQVLKMPSVLSQKREIVAKSNRLHQLFGDKTESGSSRASERKIYVTFKVKKVGKESRNVGKKGIRRKKTTTVTHSSDIPRNKRGRKARNFIDTRYYGIDPQSSSNFPYFPPFNVPAIGIPTSDTVATFMATQTQVEDPINEIERHGYSLQSATPGLGQFSRGSPFHHPTLGIIQLPNRGEEYGFPAGPPPSMFELSEKADRFPAATLFPGGESGLRQTWYPPRVLARDDDHSIAPETRKLQPNTVSAALSLFPYHPPLAFSPEQPLLQSNGDDYQNSEKKTDQHEPNNMQSPFTNTLDEISFLQDPQITPREGTPEFSEERTQHLQLPEESTKDEGENGMHEITEHNEPRLTEGGEAASQDSKQEYSRNDKGQGVPEEADLNFIPGVMGAGLGNLEASLLKQQVEGGSQKEGVQDMEGINGPLSTDNLQSMERDNGILQENAVARQEAPRTEENIQKGALADHTNDELNSPTPSIDSIEKMIDSAGTEDAKALYNMDATHGYSSSSRRPAFEADQGAVDSQGLSEQVGHQGNGKYIHNPNWEYSPLNQGKSLPDVNLKLENALSEWNSNALVHPSHDFTSSIGTLADNPPEKLFNAPQESIGNSKIVPGVMVDTQGQQMIPLFLPNLPLELRDDSNIETVLMVPPTVNKLKGHIKTKKGKIKKKGNEKTV